MSSVFQMRLADRVAAFTNASLRHTHLLHGYGIPAHLLGKYLSPHMAQTVVRHRSGYAIEVDPTEYSGRVIALCGDYDGRIGEVMARAARPGSVVLDIGGLYGTEALTAARKVGPGGHVHVFEPQKAVAEGLRRTMALNGLTCVTVHEVAMSDRDGLATLTRPSTELGARNQGDVAITTDGIGEPVRLVDAGVYLADHDILDIDVVKLDVQGHEATVLRSVFRTLTRLPPCIVFESMTTGIPIAERHEMKLLLEADYEIGEIQGSIMRLTIRPVDESYIPNSRHIDFVALERNASAENRRALGWLTPDTRAR
jgi:FkbM family methyltransferase